MAKQRLAALVVVIACLCAPAAARANGDPASDYLLAQNVFLPFTTKIDNNEVQRLDALLRESHKAGFPIRVAMILSPSDLGTAFSLFGKPQKYAAFLGLELSFVYRDRLLVVMPNGYGYTVKADPDPKGTAVLKTLPPPDAMRRRRSRRRSSQCSGWPPRTATGSQCRRAGVPPAVTESRLRPR